MDPAVSFSSFPHISCTSLGAPQAQICPENTLFDTKLWRTSGVSRVSDPSEKDWGQGARKPKAETLCATWELDGVHCQSWWISHSFLFLFVQLLSPQLHTWDACRFAKYQMKVELHEYLKMYWVSMYAELPLYITCLLSNHINTLRNTLRKNAKSLKFDVQCHVQ